MRQELMPNDGSEERAMRNLGGVAAVSLALALMTSVALPSAAEAQSRGVGRASQPSFVYAESRFGHGTVSGPVRPGPRGGYEVRMPGGTWIPCGRCCSETLRVETVDFWENKGAGNKNRIDNECGLFGCLSRGFRF
jgi:hypothetical protein